MAQTSHFGADLKFWRGIKIPMWPIHIGSCTPSPQHPYQVPVYQTPRHQQSSTKYQIPNAKYPPPNTKERITTTKYQPPRNILRGLYIRIASLLESSPLNFLSLPFCHIFKGNHFRKKCLTTNKDHFSGQVEVQRSGFHNFMFSFGNGGNW